MNLTSGMPESDVDAACANASTATPITVMMSTAAVRANLPHSIFEYRFMVEIFLELRSTYHFLTHLEAKRLVVRECTQLFLIFASKTEK